VDRRWNVQSAITGYFSNLLKRPWKIALIIVVLIVEAAVIFFVFNLSMEPRYIIEYEKASSPVPVIEITKDIVVEQTIIVDHNIYGISLLLDTYGLNKTSHYQVKIDNLSENITVFSKTVNAADITDGYFYTFPFDEQVKENHGAKYRISIQSDDAVKGNAISVMSSQEADLSGGDLSVNGQKQTGKLIITTTAKDSAYNPTGLFLNRLMLVVLLFAFILLHLLIDINEMYKWIFEKRLWIACAVIIFMVANQYNQSSLTIYNEIIQYNQGSEYIVPIFGQPRSIKSDEWLVSTPARLSAQYSNYSEYNEILRAEKASNLSGSGLYFDFSALARPTEWCYYLLGSAGGLSFSWSSFLVISFLMSFEMCLILSNNKKLISLLGASLIVFSGCFQWWSGVFWIFSGQGSIVCIYYFIQTESKLKKLLFGIGIAIFGSNFITNLYPAWQVPAGYLFLGILVWILITDHKKIQKFDKFDWGTLGVSLVLLALICLSYLMESREYLKAIMDTAYPGKRYSYGGFSIDKLFNYIQVLLYPFKGMRDISQDGVFLNFYPIPTILTLYLLIKKKGKDLISVILLGISLLFSIYCIVEIPALLAKTLLLTYSTPDRLVDIVGFIQIYLLVTALSRFEGIKKINTAAACIIGIASVSLAVYFCQKRQTAFFSFSELIVFEIFFILACTLLMSNISKLVKNTLIIGLICISIVSGSCVNPIVKGLDVIYTKPVAKEILSIVKEDSGGKWITINNVIDSGFLVSCGAPTINSTNYIPNYELWKKLDPQGDYNEVYNRYAHMEIRLVFSPTSVTLENTDSIKVNLSYRDMQKIGIKYVFCKTLLKNNEYVSFKTLYNEFGCYIYETEYK